MQVVILAGGFGTRLSEETDNIPKPMVEIGGQPILLHIMRYYASFGHKDFVVALGYKKEIIEEYFRKALPSLTAEGWKVNLVDTGLSTGTGGRILRLKEQLEKDFLFTYGDGLSNVNLDALIIHHKNKGKIATVTAVRPPARFGSIDLIDGVVERFSEKSPQDVGWINGGFFYLSRKVCEYISDENASFEGDPLNAIVQKNNLAAYEHHGWWQPMDTLRDKRTLEAIWEEGNAPWVIDKDQLNA